MRTVDDIFCRREMNIFNACINANNICLIYEKLNKLK